MTLSVCGANVIVLGIAARAGHRISFWTFPRYGRVVTFASLVGARRDVWLRYFVLA